MTQARFIDVGGRRLRHVILGEDGEAIVLVHGFAGSLESWEANQSALAKEGYTVAALDLPGHGESSLDVGSGSLDELAASVLAYMDAVGIQRAHLVGRCRADEELSHAFGKGRRSLAAGQARPLALAKPIRHARLCVGRRIDHDRQKKRRIIGHVVHALDREPPLTTKVALGARIAVG
jgi:hypothetical protein